MSKGIETCKEETLNERKIQIGRLATELLEAKLIQYKKEETTSDELKALAEVVKVFSDLIMWE